MKGDDLKMNAAQSSHTMEENQVLFVSNLFS